MLLSQMLKRKVSLPPGGKARIDCLHSHVLCSFLVTARAVCVPVSFEAFHVRIAGCCFVGITVIRRGPVTRSEEHTSALQSLMTISSAGFCLKKKKTELNEHYLTTSTEQN